MSGETNYYCRSGKVFYTNGDDTNHWAASFTELTASEKDGAGDGTITVHAVNTSFERLFVEYINNTGSDLALSFFIVAEQEDGTELRLDNIKFWSLPANAPRPIGNKLDFTFEGITSG